VLLKCLIEHWSFTNFTYVEYKRAGKAFTEYYIMF